MQTARSLVRSLQAIVCARLRSRLGPLFGEHKGCETRNPSEAGSCINCLSAYVLSLFSHALRGLFMPVILLLFCSLPDVDITLVNNVQDYDQLPFRKNVSPYSPNPVQPKTRYFIHSKGPGYLLCYCHFTADAR